MKTVEKLNMLRLQGKPEHIRAAHVLSREVAKRAAALKLTRLQAKLSDVVGKGDSCEKY